MNQEIFSLEYYMNEGIKPSQSRFVSLNYALIVDISFVYRLVTLFTITFYSFVGRIWS
jgi:hypothetical protein